MGMDAGPFLAFDTHSFEKVSYLEKNGVELRVLGQVAHRADFVFAAQEINLVVFCSIDDDDLSLACCPERQSL